MRWITAIGSFAPRRGTLLRMTTTPTRTGMPAKVIAEAPPDVTLKVLIADKFEAAGVEGLRNLGCSITSNPDLTPETLPAAMAELDPDVLIVRGSKVPAKV